MGFCRPTIINNWKGGFDGIDSHYTSFLNIEWDQISNVLENLKDRDTYHGVGLLNFNDSEIDHWKKLIPEAEHVVLHLNYASSNITWNVLYPEWIDEEEEYEFPTCPTLPRIQVPGKPRLDLIAVKLPCNKSGCWLRDVARLHLQIEAARLAASSKGNHPVHVLLVTDCFPIPNLFTCKELIQREGNAWLYEPNLNTLREKLQLPIGSCELAVPLKAKGQIQINSCFYAMLSFLSLFLVLSPYSKILFPFCSFRNVQFLFLNVSATHFLLLKTKKKVSQAKEHDVTILEISSSITVLF